jgi:hypothetical protein
MPTRTDHAVNRSHSHGHRLLFFLELQIAMALGALVCLLVGRVIRATSIRSTDYNPGTFLFFFGDVLFLALPVMAWMLFRGYGRWHSLEVAVAMLAPVAAIVVMGEMTGSPYLLWLVVAMYPAMSVGMLAYTLIRGDVFDRGRHVVAKLAS